MSKNQIIFSKIKEKGVIPSLKVLFNNLIFKINKYVFSVEIMIVSERELNQEIRDFLPKIDVHTSKISLDQLYRFKNKIKESKAKLFEQRVKATNITGFMVLDKKDQLVAFAWVSSKDDNEIGSRTKLKVLENEAILLDDFTFQNFRGNKIQKYLICERLKYLKNNNFKKAIATYSSDNEFSRKAFLANNFDEIKIIYVISIFGKKLRLSKWL